MKTKQTRPPRAATRAAPAPSSGTTAELSSRNTKALDVVEAHDLRDRILDHAALGAGLGEGQRTAGEQQAIGVFDVQATLQIVERRRDPPV